MTDLSSERVGRYQLLEPIGAGPNGMVARAKVFGVAGFERQFAIKRFSPELTAAPPAAQALSAAARSYGSLEHPRIARMSEFGVAQGQTFTAVELVVGLDAMRLVAESKLGGSGLAAGGALALISQAARAVGYAHGRGLSHLGLSPTNVIVTAEGDVKVTDFGILAATLSSRPVDQPRLAQRVGYLAPEQLVGESTSAATDVFVLGVIAYELVTGQRAFFGDTPNAVAQAILAGPPAEPPLPRPIVRVLGRCLARSQFERFPDARAFADALDAALRVAPVPGTRKEIGAQVKTVLDRHAAMNEGNLSGVVAINVGAFRAPEAISAQTLPTPPIAPAPPVRESAEEIATTNFVRPDVPVARPAPLVGPRDLAASATMPDLHKQLTTTVPGLVVPPPIPVPPGIASAQPPAIPPPGGVGPSTMLGISAGKKSPQLPSVVAQIKPKPNPNGPAARSPAPTPPAALPTVRAPTPPPIAPELGLGELDLDGPDVGPTRPDADRYRTDPAGLPTARAGNGTGGSQLSDEPPTVPHEVGPEVHARGGLQPFAKGTAGRAPVDTRDDALADPPKPEPSRAHPGLRTTPGIGVRATGATPPPTPKASRTTGPSPVVPPSRTTGPSPVVPPSRTTGPSPVATPPAVTADPSTLAMASAEGGGPSRSNPTTSPPFTREHATNEMPPDLVSDLKRASQNTATRPAVTPDGDPLIEMSLEVHGGVRPDVPRPNPSPASTLFGVAPAPVAPSSPPPMRESGPTSPRMPSPTPPSLVAPGNEPSLMDAGLAAANQPPVSTVPNLAPPPPGRAGGQPFSRPNQQRRRARWPIVVLLLLVVGGGVGVFVWQMWLAGNVDEGATKVASGSGSKKSGSGMSEHGTNGNGTSEHGNGTSGSGSKKSGSGTSEHGMSGSGTSGSGTSEHGMSGSATSEHATSGSGASGSGTTMAGSATSDHGTSDHAGSAAATNGSGATKPGKEVAQPTGASDALQIASTPAGARVFIDGADQGVTPVKLPGSSDRHTMALLLAGNDLYVAEVDGHGSFQVPLKPVTPSGGPAGIKVIKCKDKDRYYVFVDGKPTGMTCPTERIECDVGPHTVEVYDLVTENRRKWDIKVTDTRLSYRVRVD